MTKQELVDIAHEIATSNITTESMGQQEWEQCNTSDILWEPFENFPAEFTEQVVSSIAYSVMNRFEFLVDENE